MKKWIYTGLMALGLLGFAAGVWPQARTSFKIFDEGAFVSTIQSINCIGTEITCTENLSAHRVDLSVAVTGAAPLGAQFVTLALDGILTAERVLTGTVNQIIITDGGANSTVTLSIPQDIHTGAAPTFASLDLNDAVNQITLDADEGSGFFGTITLDTLTAARLYTFPDSSGEVALLPIDLTTSDVTGVLPIANGGTDLSTVPTNGQLLIGNGTDYTLATLTGTVNQITVTSGSGSITLSTPQDIHTGASPTFANLNLDNRLNHSGDADTFIDFNTDEIEIEVGGTFFVRMTEGATDVFTINPNSGDVDFIVETDITADAFTIDAGANTATFNVLLTVNNISINDAINQILFDADGTFTGQLTLATLTASQTWTLPDSTGTIALVSSVGGFAAEVIDKEATDFSTTLATEQTVYSFTIPGGLLGTESQVRVNVTGDMAGGTAATTYRMKYGATTLVTLVGTPGNDPSPVKIIMSLNADDATGSQQAHFLIFHDDTNSDSAVGTSAEDSTGDLVFELTVETTNAAQNYTMQHTVMELSQ